MTLIMSFLIPAGLYAQNADERIKAFSESYALESTGELQKSIEVMRWV